MAWWSTWPNAARDHETFCVSCHTALPYALAKPSLRGVLGQSTPSPDEAKLMDNVVKRVRLWNEVAPFYPDQRVGLPKTSESRGTEAIINALVLTTRDAQAGKLSADARAALGNLWALQMKTGDLAGAWAWLNFKYQPWEAAESAYYGATLAALAIGSAPENYAASADVQENVKLLRGFFSKGIEHQHLFNRVMLLWASTKLNGLVTPEQRDSIVADALAKQEADGGWATAALGPWQRVDGTPLDMASDGYATGLMTFVLQQTIPTPSSSQEIEKGIRWLLQHQEKQTGRWLAVSLNKKRDPASDPAQFMNDAATAYAVLALTRAGR
jgi:squalene-hopene/tetraprenyl-beta-curcumene cyclase